MRELFSYSGCPKMGQPLNIKAPMTVRVTSPEEIRKFFAIVDRQINAFNRRLMRRVFRLSEEV